MALRLYRTTRQLYGQVTRALQTLHVRSAVGANPTRFGLVALYVTGLVLLDARPSQARVSQALPARAHDALNRLLRTVPLSTRALLAGPVRLAAGLDRPLGPARGLSAVAAQAELCSHPLSEEDGAGRGAAARAGSGGVPGRLPGGRHRLYGRGYQQGRRPVGSRLGGDPQPAHDGRVPGDAAG